MAQTKGLGIASASTSVDTTAGGTELLAANTQRRFLLVQNKGAADVYLRVDGGTVTSSNGLTLAPGAYVSYFAAGGVPVGQVKALSSSGTITVYYEEG